MTNNSILALFDIDGTILSSGPGARKSLSQAIHEVAEQSFTIEPGDCAGKTDPLIIVTFLEKAGFPPEEYQMMLKMIKERYLELLIENFNANNDAYVYPGIEKLFEKISEHTHICLGLLTGNFEKGARIKLEPFQLNPALPVGAFGDDGFLRTDLSQIAVNRAEKYYDVQFDPQNIVVIGDTADDVACGKVLNARTIGISRRETTLETLKAANPDHLFIGSENTEKFIASILG